MKQNEVLVFQTIENLSEYLFSLISDKIPGGRGDEYFTLALSGGSTPKKILSQISGFDKNSIDWKKVRLFWVDERCVPPDDQESNYNMVYQNLLNTIDIPEENIFRIYGENNPENEALRYSTILEKNIYSEKGLLKFDMVLLGLGEDGHTASIFPGNNSLFGSAKYCEAVVHPQSGQHRITLTGPVINNSDTVVFLVTGKSKAGILQRVLNQETETDLPASKVKPTKGNLLWIIDKEAAGQLDKDSYKSM